MYVIWRTIKKKKKRVKKIDKEDKEGRLFSSRCKLHTSWYFLNDAVKLSLSPSINSCPCC